MITGILFDADIRNGGSYQMSINNLLELKKSFSNSNLKLPRLLVTKQIYSGNFLLS